METTMKMNEGRKRKRVCIEDEPSSNVNKLPTEMVVDILANVAADSFDAFFSAKQCCKFFVRASEDDFIYKRLTLNVLPDKLWWTPKKAKALVRRCISCGNAEALYWQGLFEFFSTLNLDEGINLIREAAREGDVGALYILGVIYVCSDDAQLKRGGGEILKKVHREGKVSECREKFQRVIESMWMNNRSIFRKKPSYACPMRAEHWKDGLWRSNALVRDGVHCEACIFQADSMFLYIHCPPAM
ncbi:hypothetical protein MLD38_008727 [Melastoma candidum]|uniref:Uncharacterized protein n=1 Tax=Melastoma candidum TaxID=119954 RepID=A0ACB9RV88_9MYRT|nr:hypothetical protein MLD38_008727 [Melastoma candidum]